MLGYAERSEDLALGDVMHGELRTGDLGRLDSDGYLFLSGRSKRIAKIHGVRINLDEVEVDLRTHGPAAVVALPDGIRGFCAFGSDDSLLEMARDLARRYRLHHSTIGLTRVKEIPVTSSGKVDYEVVGSWIA
jgi:acyl-coenzyme A synthetase/AMP-(fatty) acid ligase